MKYTKKPITIEAVKWDGDKFEGPDFAPWLQEAFNKNQLDAGAVWFGKELKYIMVRTLHGIAEVKPGDYLVKSPAGDLYPCDARLFEQMHEMDQNSITILNPISELTKLQNEVGYVKGDINVIALLGLFGEAGEVLNETFLIDNSGDEIKAEDLKMEACERAKKIDALKKLIRDNKTNIKADMVYHMEGDIIGKRFNIELSDVFYYLNALAINRGLTLQQLAQLCLEKIKSKQLQKNISHGANIN